MVEIKVLLLAPRLGFRRDWDLRGRENRKSEKVKTGIFWENKTTDKFSPMDGKQKIGGKIKLRGKPKTRKEILKILTTFIRQQISMVF